MATFGAMQAKNIQERLIVSEGKFRHERIEAIAKSKDFTSHILSNILYIGQRVPSDRNRSSKRFNRLWTKIIA